MCKILLLLALLQSPPVYFSAVWDTKDSATVTWTQTTRSCLYKEGVDGSVFLGCYERRGTVILTFGAVGPLDGAYRPRAGNVYRLYTGGQIYSAPLRGRNVYLASVRR